jgi:tetratricopeptide (TPR) repeat protein
MAGKTRSAKQEGNHGPGWPAPPPGSVEEACRLHERAVAVREHGQHAEAATCARYALASFEREYGPDHPDVANILNNLAGIYADQGYYTEAARLAQRSVTIMEQTTGSPDLELLRIQSLRTLAGVYRAQGGYAESESLYQRALASAEAAMGTDHLETAACPNDTVVEKPYARLLGEAAWVWSSKQRKVMALRIVRIKLYGKCATLYPGCGCTSCYQQSWA